MYILSSDFFKDDNKYLSKATKFMNGQLENTK